MNITFRQLRLFLALAETGSVSAAAKVMHVTQPTASMQLREVTQAVGVPLYEVVSRRVHLTEAGQALARTARAIAGEWDAFEQRISGAKGLTSGRLKVAVVSTAKYFVPRLLGSFCKLHPQIDISLEVLNRDHVITRLRSQPGRSLRHVHAPGGPAAGGPDPHAQPAGGHRRRRPPAGRPETGDAGAAAGRAVHPARERLRHPHGHRCTFAPAGLCAQRRAGAGQQRGHQGTQLWQLGFFVCSFV
jgi:DNA-binding transcriptional LysR family regulator